MKVQVYLNFNGRCEEAIEFYKRTLGAQVTMLMRFKDNPEANPPAACTPENVEKVMHSAFTIGETELMATDGMPGEEPGFKGFTLSVPATDEAHAKSLFGNLSDGGKVLMPLTRTFWSPCFGMLTDRFGIQWMVSIPAPA